MVLNQKTARAFLQGWNAALEVVRRGLADMPDDSLTPDQQALREWVLDFINARLFPEDLLTLKPTNAELAVKYDCSLRTISNWRREGCPLEDGQWRVLDWLSDRHCVPKSTAVKFAKQFARRNCKPVDTLGLQRRFIRVAKLLGAS
jgi:hypothetical protein